MDDSEKLLLGLKTMLKSFGEVDKFAEELREAIKVKLHDIAPDRYRDVIAFQEGFSTVTSKLTATSMVEEYTTAGVRYVRTSTRQKPNYEDVTIKVARIDGIEKITISNRRRECCLVCQLAGSHLDVFDSHEKLLQSIASDEAPVNLKSPWASRG